MSTESMEGTQPLPEGEAVPETPATENAPETGTEQTPEQTEEATEEEKRPKHKPWFQERIDQLTREKYDERRRAEALEARLADTLSDPEKAKSQPANLDELATKKAAEIVAARQFDDKCNEVYSSGKSEFQDFDDTLGNFRMLGGLPQPVLEAVTELPDAHKVLYALGSNMDEAARIFSLAPVPMAVALAKLSSSPAKAKPVSNAPKPIRPIDGTPKGDPDPESMSTADWIKWREAELNKRG